RGWDSNPRYPFRYTRVPGVRLQPLGHLSMRHSAESVGFETTIPFPVCLISSQVPSNTRPALQYSLVAFLLAQSLEEFLQKQAALVRQNSTHDLEPVIVPGLLGEVVERTNGSRFGVHRAEHQTCHTGLNQCTSAHRARLQRHVKRDTREPPRSQRLGRCV